MRPKVGVGVIVIKDNKVLIGKRIGSHGEGTWQFPGGHLENGEHPIECAKRELFEEAGLTVKNTRIGPYTNDVFEAEQKHYITLYILADHHSGEPIIKEPHKCEVWKWCSWDELPEPLFLPVMNLLKQNFSPFNSDT